MATNKVLLAALAGAGGLLLGVALTKYQHTGHPWATSGDTANALPVGPASSRAQHAPSAPRLLIEEIRKGGYILYFRHSQRQKWDSVIAFDVFELATGSRADTASYRDAVCLTPQGREEASMIGKIFELAKIPVGAIGSSPSCRARESAELAFGKPPVTSAGLAHTPVTNPENAGAFSAELKRVLTTIAIDPDKNAVILAHGNTLENNKHLFARGTEYLAPPLISETGFFVIKRGADGSLQIVHKFQNLGDFAASAVTLNIDKP